MHFKSSSSASFKDLTTFRSGGTARHVMFCENEHDVRDAIQFAKRNTFAWYVLGEGSNVLARETGFDGVILRMVSKGTTHLPREDRMIVRARAGVSWNKFVDEVTAKELWGVENLAGIPGTIGAAPVQNIGAYGVELADIFFSARVYDAKEDAVYTFTKEQCGFGYRESVFKQNPHLVILSVDLILSDRGEVQGSYPDVIRAQKEGADLSTPRKVAEAIRAIRKEKFPDLSIYGTAGSFFKNPIIAVDTYEELLKTYPQLPSFSVGSMVKVPLAYILDKVLSLRGYRRGNAWLYDKQPLVLVLDAGGTSDEVETLAQDVEQKVWTATGIHVEREVRML